MATHRIICRSSSMRHSHHFPECYWCERGIEGPVVQAARKQYPPGTNLDVECKQHDKITVISLPPMTCDAKESEVAA
jgi:hypothetical protein